MQSGLSWIHTPTLCLDEGMYKGIVFPGDCIPFQLTLKIHPDMQKKSHPFSTGLI